jgi:hypothetical protein
MPLTGFRLDSGTGVILGTTNRILVTWNTSTDEWVLGGGSIEINHKKSSEANWTVTWMATGESYQQFISPVEAGVAYDVRARAINSLSVNSAWVEIDAHVVGSTKHSVSVLAKTAETPAALGAALVL